MMGAYLTPTARRNLRAVGVAQAILSGAALVVSGLASMVSP